MCLAASFAYAFISANLLFLVLLSYQRAVIPLIPRSLKRLCSFIIAVFAYLLSLTECNCLLKYQCPQLPAKYYLFLKHGITCCANNCKDLVSGKSGNHTLKYVTPICKYLFISLMTVSG